MNDAFLHESLECTINCNPVEVGLGVLLDILVRKRRSRPEEQFKNFHATTGHAQLMFAQQLPDHFLSFLACHFH